MDFAGPWVPYDESLGSNAESKYLLPLEVDEEPLLREIDELTSAWIGLPAPDRTGLWMKRHRRATPQKGDAVRRPAAIPANLHVDNHRMPHRLGTVIIYCENVTADSGGETVFPCLLEQPQNAAASQSSAKLRQIRRDQCIAAGGSPPAGGRVTAYGEAHDPFGVWKLAGDACVSKNDEFCIKNEKICIKTKSFVLRMMHFAEEACPCAQGHAESRHCRDVPHWYSQ